VAAGDSSIRLYDRRMLSLTVPQAAGHTSPLLQLTPPYLEAQDRLLGTGCWRNNIEKYTAASDPLPLCPLLPHTHTRGTMRRRTRIRTEQLSDPCWSAVLQGEG